MKLDQIRQDQDAAKRIHEAVALALASSSDPFSEVVGKWMVFKLEDGSTDHVLYDNKDDAVRMMKGRSKDYCYLKLTPDGITVKDAGHYLKANRHPMIDTTAPEPVINPALFPRFSNLTPGQKAFAKREAERQYREQHG